MANKDITATTIANILALILTANSFANASVKESKSYREGISKSRNRKPSRITPDPGKAASALKIWFDRYIKPGATSAGTATVSSTFTTTAQWRTNFFNTRTQLLANASPEAIAALDKWFSTYSEYRVDFGKN